MTSDEIKREFWQKMQKSDDLCDEYVGMRLAFNRLKTLLAHAVKKADDWHDDSWGGPIEDDPLMDEARALLAGSTDTIQPHLSTIRDTASDMLKKHGDTLKMHYEHDGRMWDVEVRVLDVVANPSSQSPC